MVATMGLCGVPEEPYCVGMDEPLNKLKIKLLKDGVSVLVLTGLPGSGKTTLAKKLCWDPQIKGNFTASNSMPLLFSFTLFVFFLLFIVFVNSIVYCLFSFPRLFLQMECSLSLEIKCTLDWLLEPSNHGLEYV